MSPITLSTLKSKLDNAANALRGPIEPADFKNYVFPMLFWKWLSDTWVYEHEDALAEYSDDLDDEIEADFHRFEMPAGTLWGEITTKVTNLGAEIAKNFRQIEKANPTSLSRVFGDAPWADKDRIPEAALLNLIKAFDEIDLNPATVSHDLLGAGYEYLLKNFADDSGKKAGEFFTPREVVNLLVGILEPEPGESVYDPTCGSGGMLVATINQLRDQGKDHRTLRAYGQEINLTTASIARMNLFLHEIEDFDVKRGDTLRTPAFKNTDGSMRTFDTVIANPPFSLKNWGAERWESDPRAICGVPPEKSADYAFIQHMIASMDPMKGRVGVVMPNGVLFRGHAEGRIRECLIEKDLLEAVITLPSNLFFSTGIPACILVFRAEKPAERHKKVLFIDGSERFERGKNQNVMTSADIKAIQDTYLTGEDPDGEDGVRVRLVDLAEIRENGHDLNIGRYVQGAAKDTVDLETALGDYAAAREARIASEDTMFAKLAAAGIDMSAFEVIVDE